VCYFANDITWSNYPESLSNDYKQEGNARVRIYSVFLFQDQVLLAKPNYWKPKICNELIVLYARYDIRAASSEDCVFVPPVRKHRV